VTRGPGGGAARAALVVLALGDFLFGAAEFAIVGVLDVVARLFAHFMPGAMHGREDPLLDSRSLPAQTLQP
jgi:hypothetical protein